MIVPSMHRTALLKDVENVLCRWVSSVPDICRHVHVRVGESASLLPTKLLPLYGRCLACMLDSRDNATQLLPCSLSVRIPFTVKEWMESRAWLLCWGWHARAFSAHQEWMRIKAFSFVSSSECSYLTFIQAREDLESWQICRSMKKMKTNEIQSEHKEIDSQRLIGTFQDLSFRTKVKSRSWDSKYEKRVVPSLYVRRRSRINELHVTCLSARCRKWNVRTGAEKIVKIFFPIFMMNRHSLQLCGQARWLTYGSHFLKVE